MDLGYTVEIHVLRGSIPDEIITPERLAAGVRAVLVRPRSEIGLLLVLECPGARRHWHVRVDSLEDRAAELETFLSRGSVHGGEWN
jgi:hypothetical protein